MKRYKHSLSNYKLLTCKMGELVPVNCVEVLPGDTMQQTTSALMRLAPMLAPVMHPVSVRFHHWFVPNRLVWAGWEDFITGGADGEGGDSGAYPTITAGGGGFSAGGLHDYFGIKPAVASLVVSALPFRAYGLIFNEYYRDQDLVTARVVSTGSGADSTTDQTLATIAWEKDYFTSARPWPQKGPDVTLPLGTEAPITRVSNADPWKVYESGSNTLMDNKPLGSSPTTGLLRDTGGSAFASLDPDGGLIADLSNATAVNVNDVRLAFALQRYQEARAMFGSRYTEYLRYLGVRSSDARLQRPEYLGGGKQVVSFSEVLQTGPDSSDEGVANLKGHGISATRTRRYRKFFEEHGHVITLMSVRPRSIYGDLTEKMWLRRTKEDYWQKELEAIGSQEVARREIYAEAGSGGDTIFGYQDRYAEYRHVQSGVAGDFRTSLNYWHLARLLGSAPTLNSTFVTCTPSPRIFAEQTEDNLWCMISNSIQARRMVGRPRVGRIL